MNKLKADEKFIKRCLDLAQKGSGNVSPNPLVGCVIAKNNVTLAEGWHAFWGGPHAEAQTIKNAKTNLHGATLYCNLEPCSHNEKQTPPCTPLIINSGIKRVVIANLDKNPKVAGNGVQQLRNAGLQVETGILEQAGAELNRFFFKHIVHKKPWVTIKIAQTLDTKISKKKGSQTWITGNESRSLVHQLRTLYDAVLVGSGTIYDDNPKLNIRFSAGRNPQIIVIAGHLNIPKDAQILSSDSKVWIFHHIKIDSKEHAHLLKDNIHLVRSPQNKHGLILMDWVLTYLGNENINSILVEGGQQIFSQLINQKHFDELIILQSPKIFGSGLVAAKLNSELYLKTYSAKTVGEDCYINLRKKI